jgi:hypothetical protein
MMRNLLIVLVLLVAIGVGVGFYLNWFHLSTGGSDSTAPAGITVDKDKIKADEEKAKGAVQDLENKAKEKTGTVIGTGKREAHSH